MFQELHLDSRLSTTELAVLPNSPYADLEGAADSYGLAEYLGGAPVAWSRFAGGETTHPLGWASVRAAAAWHRVTGAAVPDQWLEKTAPEYLPLHRRHDQYDRTSELTWASERVNETIRLLASIGGARWTVFDYILDRISAEGMPVLETTWVAVGSAHLDPWAAIRAGFAAVEASKLDVAQGLFHGISQLENADHAVIGATALGVVLDQQGDLAGAEEAYRLAIHTRQPDMSPLAAVNLGQILDRRGNFAAAAQAYQLAIDSRHVDQAPLAAMNLGVLRQRQEDPVGAEQAYKLAIDSGHSNWAPKALYNLGVLRRQRNDVAGAEQAFQLAVESGNPESAPRSAVSLGTLRQDQGDLSGAQYYYQLAIDSAHTEETPKAALALGVIRFQQGDLVEAEDAFRLVIESGHTRYAPRAAFDVGVVLEVQENLVGAEQAYKLAIDSGDPEVAPMARKALDRLRMR